MKMMYHKKAILGIAMLLLGMVSIIVPVNAELTHEGSIVDGAGGAHLISPNGVFVSGNYAYVTAADSNALEIVDVSDPAAPVHKGSITDGQDGAYLFWPRNVYVKDNYAYVAAYFGGLEIVDVSDPTNPVHKGKFDVPTSTDIYVSGNYAYLTCIGGHALVIIDISDPAAPVYKGGIADGNGGAHLFWPTSVYVSGNYAYVTSADDNALNIVDVSNPAAPVLKGIITHGEGGALLATPYSVYVSGNYAYVASGSSNSLEIIDVSNPAAPHHEGSISGAWGPLLGDAHDVFISGNYAYVVSYVDALEVIDITDPSAPVEKESIVNGAGGALLRQPTSVYVSGNYAYVASSFSDALEIIDLGLNLDSTPPSVIVSFPAPDGNNGWFINAPVTGSVTTNDPSDVASISCTGADVSDLSGINTPTATASLSVIGEGTHNIYCTATDGLGNSGAESGSVNTATVNIDTVPPQIVSLSVSPNTIWPPNHKMVDVTISGSASDILSGVTSVKGEIADEYSTLNIPPVARVFTATPGAPVSFSLPVKLEAWRNGNDPDGRVYAIHVTTTDEAGNTVISESTVLVPHDKRK